MIYADFGSLGTNLRQRWQVGHFAERGKKEKIQVLTGVVERIYGNLRPIKTLMARYLHNVKVLNLKNGRLTWIVGVA